MPTLLNFQGSTHLFGVGSFSYDTFYPGSDTLEEDDDELDLYGLDRDDLEMMDEEDMRIDLEDAGLEPDNYDDF